MKKILFLTAVFVLTFSVAAFAESKIGVFSMQAVVAKCDYGKAMQAKLKAKFEPMQKDLQRSGEAIKKLEDELKNQDMALKLEAKQDKAREYRRMVRDQQDSVAAFRQKYQAEVQKLRGPMNERVMRVVHEYGKANGYTIIMEMAVSVAYIADGVDLTDAIVAELNKLKKAGK